METTNITELESTVMRLENLGTDEKRQARFSQYLLIAVIVAVVMLFLGYEGYIQPLREQWAIESLRNDRLTELEYLRQSATDASDAYNEAFNKRIDLERYILNSMRSIRVHISPASGLVGVDASAIIAAIQSGEVDEKYKEARSATLESDSPESAEELNSMINNTEGIVEEWLDVLGRAAVSSELDLAASLTNEDALMQYFDTTNDEFQEGRYLWERLRLDTNYFLDANSSIDLADWLAALRNYVAAQELVFAPGVQDARNEEARKNAVSLNAQLALDEAVTRSPIEIAQREDENMWSLARESILRIGAVILVLYLAQVLISYSRYHFRMANRFFALSVALDMSIKSNNLEKFESFAVSLLPDIDFGKMPGTPTDKLVDVLKSAIDKINPQPAR